MLLDFFYETRVPFGYSIPLGLALLFVLPLGSAIWYILFFIAWLVISFMILGSIAVKKSEKINTIYNNCDLESYTVIYEKLSKLNNAHKSNFLWKVFYIIIGPNKDTKWSINLSLSTAYLQIGNYSAALQVLSSIGAFPKKRKFLPKKALYCNNLFVYHIRINDIKTAEKWLNEFEVTIQNDKFPKKEKEGYLDLLEEKQNILRLEKGNLEDLEERFLQDYYVSKENKVKIGQVDAKYLLGKFYLKSGKEDEAEEAFAYAVEHGGSFIFGKYALEQLEAMGRPVTPPERTSPPTVEVFSKKEKAVSIAISIAMFSAALSLLFGWINSII